MTTFANIYSLIWDDKKFRNLSLPAQVLFVHFISHPHITLTGIYELNMDDFRPKYELKLLEEYRHLFKAILQMEITPELGNNIIEYSKARFNQVFAEIIDKKMVKYDPEKEMIFVISRFKYLPSQNSPQVIKGVIKELNRHKHPFCNEFLKIYEEEFRYYRIFLNGIQVDEKELNDPKQLKIIKQVESTPERVVNFLTYKNYEPEFIGKTIDRMFRKE